MHGYNLYVLSHNLAAEEEEAEEEEISSTCHCSRDFLDGSPKMEFKVANALQGVQPHPCIVQSGGSVPPTGCRIFSAHSYQDAGLCAFGSYQHLMNRIFDFGNSV
eukprot:s733_g4.t1